jgi:hypothetical protein
MKAFRNLNASDFPEVEANKFDEWKKSVMKTRLIINMVLIIYIVLNIKSYGTFGSLIYDTPLVILIGLLFISQFTRFATEKHPTYMLIALSCLMAFNIVLQFMTKRIAGESLVVIVVFFWLFNRIQKINRSGIELGIDSAALKRVLSR